MFVTLRTLDELEQFWEEHKGQFELACEGKGVTSGQTFLREYEWVFGTSKSAVVRTVMRWGRSGIGCDFYDWAKHDPRMHECFFHDRMPTVAHGLNGVNGRTRMRPSILPTAPAARLRPIADGGAFAICPMDTPLTTGSIRASTTKSCLIRTWLLPRSRKNCMSRPSMTGNSMVSGRRSRLTTGQASTRRSAIGGTSKRQAKATTAMKTRPQVFHDDEGHVASRHLLWANQHEARTA